MDIETAMNMLELNEHFTSDELRKKYPHAYMPWKENEDKWLRTLHAGGADVESISKMLGRQPGSIRSRIEKLELGE